MTEEQMQVGNSELLLGNIPSTSCQTLLHITYVHKDILPTSFFADVSGS
jgi:hypothetical protein